MKPAEAPGVAVASMEDPREIYTEVTKSPNMPT